MSVEKIRTLSNLSHKKWMKIASDHIDLTKHISLDKKQALEDLISIKKVFDENSISFWLIGGTLLGAVRDKDFISWDDDTDVAVYEEDFLPKYDILKEAFVSEGFIFRDAQKSMGTKINLYRYGKVNTQKNSIDCLFLNDKYENDNYRFSRVRRHPRKYFEKYEEIKFKETIFRVPSPPEKYLSFMYQKWKKVIKSSRPEKEWRNKNIYWRKGKYK